MSATDEPKELPDGPSGAGLGEHDDEGEGPSSNPMRALLRKAMAGPDEGGAADVSVAEGGGSGGGSGGGPGGGSGGDDEPDSERLREVLRKTASIPVPAPKADVLRGVQRRLRVRSQGKFYADGWSTREEHPRGTYLMTAGVMLVLLVIVYLALVPGGIGRP